MYLPPRQTNLTIAASGSVSDSAPALGLAIFGVFIASAWTPAVLTFQGSIDGNNWFPVVDEFNSELTIQATNDRMFTMAPRIPFGFPLIRLRSGTFSTPVNQAAARTVILWLREFA